MKNIVFAIIWLPAVLFAQSPVPSWVDDIPVPKQLSKDLAEIKTGWAYLLNDLQIDVESQTRFFHIVIQVTSIDGLQPAAHMDFVYDPKFQDVLFHEFSVTREGEKYELNPKIKTIVREKEMEFYLYDGRSTKYVDLDDIRVGDVISYSYSLKGFNPVYNNKFICEIVHGGEVYTEKDNNILRINQDRNIRFKYYKEKKEFSLVNRDGKKIYTLLNEKTNPVPFDENIPSWYYVNPYVSISEFSEDDLENWVLNLFKTGPITDPGLARMIKKIMDENNDPESRALKSLEFAQNDVRYLGDESGLGAYKPNLPGKVFKQRFGDCKDKSLLLSAMLNKMDIEAYPALVNTSSKEKIGEMLPSPYNFDHCIVYAKIKGKNLWLDPTRTNQGGDINNRNISNFGLALVADGVKPLLNKMEIANNSEIIVEERYTAREFTSPAILKVVTKNMGGESDYQRSYFARNELREIGKQYLNFYARYFPIITMTGEIKTQDSLRNNVFTVTEEYEIDSIWKYSMGVYKLSIDPAVFSTNVLSSVKRFRSHPLALSHPLNITNKIICLLPKEWSIKEENLSIENAFFRYSMIKNYTHEFHKLEIVYHYETLVDHVDVNDLEKYFDDQQKIRESLGTTLTYTITPAESNSHDINWYFVKLGLLTLAASLFLAYKIYINYDPPTTFRQNTRDQIGGWLVLAGVGLVLTPLVNIFGLFNENYFTGTNAWNEISNSESLKFDPLRMAVHLFNYLSGIIFIVYSVLLIILYFKRRTSLINLVIIFFLFSVFLAILELVSSRLTHVADTQNQPAELIRRVILAVIWISYFRSSVRVKETFTRNFRNVGTG